MLPRQHSTLERNACKEGLILAIAWLPSIAALLVTRINEGESGMYELLKRYRIERGASRG
jgi:hypothetical protein